MRASLLVLVTLAVLTGTAEAASAPARAPFELRADEVTLRDDGAVIEGRGNVRLAHGASRMTADRAVYVVRTRRLTLTGRVSMTTPQGNLTAASATALLTAGGGIDTLTAAGRATLTSQQRVVRAERLTYAVSSGAVTADGGVELSLPPDLAGRGDSLLMKRGEAATLRGHARLQNAEGSLDADRIDLDERTEVAFARGSVVGVYGSSRITSDAATFYQRERRAVFRGNVRATTPGRTIQAEVVTLYLRDRRVVAEGETVIRLDEQPERP